MQGGMRMISDSQILYMYKSILVPLETQFGKDESNLPLDSEIEVK
jgi:hypothetical protein